MKKLSTLSIVAMTTLSCNPLVLDTEQDAGPATDAGEETSFVFDAENIVIAAKNIYPQNINN